MKNLNLNADLKRIILLLLLTSHPLLTGLVQAQTDQPGRPPISLVPFHSVIERQPGQGIVVTCYTDQGHRTIWMYPDGKDVTSPKGRIHVELTQQKGHSLVFEDIRVKDKGNYTCKTTVDNKEYKKSFRLTVIVPTSFNETPEVQESELGQNMTLRCYAQGDPKPSIMWHFNGKPVDDNDKYKILDNGLLIHKVTVEDSGVYECRAYQIATSTSMIKEFKITVRIQHKPTFQTKEGFSDLVYGYVSGVVNLTCHATAEPKPKFEWLKDNKQVVESDSIAIFDEDHSSTLELVLNNNTMFGDYVCKAINKLGTTEKVLVLKEGNRPDPPTEVGDLEATADSVQMKITPPETGVQLPITGFRVQYVPKQSGTASWEEAKFADFNIDSDEVYSLQGLNQDTDYAIRVQSRNAAGYSMVSKEMTIRTEKIQAQTVTNSATMKSSIQSSILMLVMSFTSVRQFL